MIRIYLIILSFFSYGYAAFAVILVEPQGNWDEREIQRLFFTIEKYSILPNGLNPKRAHRFMESTSTEKDFIKEALQRKFTDKRFRIADVPATLVDLGLLHEAIYPIYSKSKECSKELCSADRWSLETKRESYFALGALLLPLLEAEQNHESIGYVLCTKMHPFFQKPRQERLFKNFCSENSLLKQGLKKEIEAIQEDKFIWFRGTQGVCVEGLGYLLDGFIETDKINDIHQLDHMDYFYATRTFSFGLSLLAGYVFDREACAFSYIHSAEPYSHNGRNIGYAVSFPKRDFVDEKTKAIWKAPKLNPAFQIFGRGEYFHPRSRGANLCGIPRENYKKTRDYATLGRKISNLLIENSTVIYWPPCVFLDDFFSEQQKEIYRAQKNPFIETQKSLHELLFFRSNSQ